MELFPLSRVSKVKSNGRMNDTFTAGIPKSTCWSIRIPCNGGINAPPTMAITKNAAPNLVSCTSTFSLLQRPAANLHKALFHRCTFIVFLSNENVTCQKSLEEHQTLQLRNCQFRKKIVFFIVFSAVFKCFSGSFIQFAFLFKKRHILSFPAFFRVKVRFSTDKKPKSFQQFQQSFPQLKPFSASFQGDFSIFCSRDTVFLPLFPQPVEKAC